jgi:hypothetical protein
MTMASKKTKVFSDTRGQKKFSSDLTKRLAEWIKDGSTLESASALCGVSSRVVRLWLTRGARAADNPELAAKESEQPYIEFHDLMRRAHAGNENFLVKAIRDATEDDWKAASWMLERRYPLVWGTRRPMPVEDDTDASQKGSADPTKIRPRYPIPSFARFTCLILTR